MSRQHHYLKTETRFYQAVERGEKNFEIRENDRGFERYDMVYLQEVVNGVRTGRELGPFEITYVLTHEDAVKYGLALGFCVFGWRKEWGE